METKQNKLYLLKLFIKLPNLVFKYYYTLVLVLDINYID